MKFKIKIKIQSDYNFYNSFSIIYIQLYEFNN